MYSMKYSSKNLEDLVTLLKRNYHLRSVLQLLLWDEQVNLPSHCGQDRAMQLEVLSEIHHAAATNPKIGILLKSLEKDAKSLNQKEQTIIRETRRIYDRAIKLPLDFVSKKTKAESESYSMWATARKNNDFKSFAPHLEKMLKFAKMESEYQGFKENPYDYWIDKHDPYMNQETIDILFTELKKGLLPLVKTIINSPIKADTSVLKTFPTSKQKSFVKKAVKKLGFDFQRGRLDKSIHPFCGGNPADIRITTRFHEDVPLDSLFSSMHETGHALYEQGLPKDTLGTPLSLAIGMGMHESQSRLWENQVGRSRAFWKYWEPIYRKYFLKQLKSVDSDTLYHIVNAVHLNPIRVDSDEVTYNLHIILRYELERKLFDGSLKVKDLPKVWKQKSQDIIGLSPKNDTVGVLQDIHWSGGHFGYFPSYTIGNMIAAQLWYTLLKQIPNLEKQFENGDFSALLKWLRKNIHQHGQQYKTMELIEKVTGEKLNPKYLIKHLQERYLPLYTIKLSNKKEKLLSKKAA